MRRWKQRTAVTDEIGGGLCLCTGFAGVEGRLAPTPRAYPAGVVAMALIPDAELPLYIQIPALAVVLQRSR